jgi:hypothetical protein
MMPRSVASIALLVLVATVAGYGLFEARKLIEGPSIQLAFPINGSATSSTAVQLTGTAENISFLSINDKPAYTDKEGHFTTRLALPPGLNILSVSAKDRFGRETSKKVAITVLSYCSLEKSV